MIVLRVWFTVNPTEMSFSRYLQKCIIKNQIGFIILTSTGIILPVVRGPNYLESLTRVFWINLIYSRALYKLCFFYKSICSRQFAKLARRAAIAVTFIINTPSSIPSLSPSSKQTTWSLSIVANARSQSLICPLIISRNTSLVSSSFTYVGNITFKLNSIFCRIKHCSYRRDFRIGTRIFSS